MSMVTVVTVVVTVMPMSSLLHPSLGVLWSSIAFDTSVLGISFCTVLHLLVGARSVDIWPTLAVGEASSTLLGILHIHLVLAVPLAHHDHVAMTVAVMMTMPVVVAMSITIDDNHIIVVPSLAHHNDTAMSVTVTMMVVVMTVSVFVAVNNYNVIMSTTVVLGDVNVAVERHV